MKYIFISLNLVLALFFATQSGAGELGFRDMKLGMDKTELIANCKETLEECRGNVCEYSSTIRGASVVVFCKFKNDKLNSIKISFSPSDYSDIKNALKERWGKPKVAAKETMSNLFGVKVKGENLLWNLKEGKIFASQYENMTKGIILIASNEMLEEFRVYQMERKYGEGF